MWSHMFVNGNRIKLSPEGIITLIHMPAARHYHHHHGGGSPINSQTIRSCGDPFPVDGRSAQSSADTWPLERGSARMRRAARSSAAEIVARRARKCVNGTPAE